MKNHRCSRGRSGGQRRRERGMERQRRYAATACARTSAEAARGARHLEWGGSAKLGGRHVTRGAGGRAPATLALQPSLAASPLSPAATRRPYPVAIFGKFQSRRDFGFLPLPHPLPLLLRSRPFFRASPSSPPSSLSAECRGVLLLLPQVCFCSCRRPRRAFIWIDYGDAVGLLQCRFVVCLC